MNAKAAPPTAPGALPLLGHTLPLLRRPLPFLASLPASGDLVTIRFGPQRVYVTCSPELTQQVLLDDRTFDKGGLLFNRIREVLGNGLGTCPHSDHRRQRRLIQPAFHPTRLPRYAEVMSQKIGDVTSSWQEGHPIDVFGDLLQITTRVLFDTMLTGARLTSTALAEMLEDFSTFNAGAYYRMFMPPPLDRLPTPGNRRYAKASVRLRARLSGIVTDYRTARADHDDLLSVMLAARDPATDDGSSGNLSDAELTDQIITFSLAGTETAAVLLSWALHLIAQYPSVEAVLHREVDGVLAGRAATFGDLPRLDVTGRIITEILRLYPPVYFLTRITTRTTQLGGYTIPAGATVAYSPYLLHHQPDLYPDPERFDPDRWKTGEGATVRAPRGTLVPFGAGPRKCIGDAFATTEATLALASIVARWRLRPTPDSHVRPVCGVTLMPQGLRMLPTFRAQGK
ncbi:cytochrome P450 [Streptomyces sp. NPDC020794]|uniref:cytochrome P450 n=1 Tax=unclassified Streptomyces TaxID=2593676 RepID=UPI0036E7DC29